MFNYLYLQFFFHFHISYLIVNCFEIDTYLLDIWLFKLEFTLRKADCKALSYKKKEDRKFKESFVRKNPNMPIKSRNKATQIKVKIKHSASKEFQSLAMWERNS